MDLYHALVRPLVTEKSTHLSQTSAKEHGPTYAFEVHPDASKFEIKEAVEKIYGVTVHQVRTMNRAGKARRFRAVLGKPHSWKRALVTVDSNSHIDLF